MNRTRAIAWVALMAAVCGGCLVQSLNPCFTEALIVQVPEVEGRWQLVKELGGGVKEEVRPWVIAKAKHPQARWYEIRSFDASNREGELGATFFKVGDDLYCDISATRGDNPSRYKTFNLIQAHLLGRVVLKDDSLRFEMLSRDWFNAAIERKEIGYPFLRRGRGGLLVDAGPDDWVAFLEKHGKTEGVFDAGRVMELKRVPEAPPVDKKATDDKGAPNDVKGNDGTTK